MNHQPWCNLRRVAPKDLHLLRNSDKTRLLLRLTIALARHVRLDGNRVRDGDRDIDRDFIGIGMGIGI